MRSSSSSNLVIFLQLDRPRDAASMPLGEHSQWLSHALGLDNNQYRVVESALQLDAIPLETVDCVVVCGLWYSEDYELYRQSMLPCLRQLYVNDIPLFAFGEGHLYLAEALGGQITKVSEPNQVGLMLLEMPASHDAMLAMTPAYCVSFSTLQYCVKQIPHIAKLLLSSPFIANYALKYRENCYSIHSQVGFTWSAMVTWLVRRPQYWQGNEAVLEFQREEIWGINMLRRFIATYSSVHPLVS